LLTDLDQALTGAADETDALIWASFVENAQGTSGDDEERLRDELGSFRTSLTLSATTSDRTPGWASARE
jgi:hypothetical protein